MKKQLHSLNGLLRENSRDILKSSDISEVEKEMFQQVASWKAEEFVYPMTVQFLADCFMKVYDKKVIILIDEYDVPLENAHFNGYYDKMVGFIRGVFENVLKTNSSLEMAVLTGCLRVPKESLFTGLNSIQSGEFSEYFGFTEQEVNDMTEYFEIPDKFSVIKEWYDGYHFGTTEIYNLSVMSVRFLIQILYLIGVIPVPILLSIS